MINGVFGLMSLDGAPIDGHDRARFFAGIAGDLQESPGCLLTARDASADSIRTHVTHDGIDLLMGELDDPDAVARGLGSAAGDNIAALAAVAHDRWGANAAWRLEGQWLLVRWRARSHSLIILTSTCLRDLCHFATNGARVAIAPDLPRLARLPWVDSELDPALLLEMVRPWHSDSSTRWATLLPGVVRLLPGECVTIRPGDVSHVLADPMQVPALDMRSFEEIVAEAEQVLRQSIRREMRRGGDVAVLLSGGLDSSLLAALAVEECGANQRVVLLTSATPAGSGVADESGWAEIVANHLDQPLVRVTPRASACAYRVDGDLHERVGGPVLSPRHYLYDAFEDAALAAGATRILDGCFGELTVSNHGYALAPRDQAVPVRRLWRRVRNAWQNSGAALQATDFFVEPSALARLHHAAVFPAHNQDAMPSRRLGLESPFGFEIGFLKAAMRTSTANDPRLRYLHPFRDRRLGQLMAGMPAKFVVHGGQSRAPTRALLRGRVPDRISSRETKMPFSPAHFWLLRQQASEALARLPAHRAAGADEWLDLHWLERSLIGMQGGKRLSPDTYSRVQATALTAEFIGWWRAVFG